jgi:pilus assembly protein CpaB
MNSKALSMSLAIGGIAVFFVQSYVSSIEEEAKKKFGTEVIVLKASKDIKEMNTINETMLEPDLIPKKFLEPAAIYWETDKRKDVDRDRKTLIGLIASVPIKKGEQIVRNKLSEPGIRTGLAPQVTPGRRAVSVPVTEITGVAKLVKPGDRVDLIVVLDMGGGKDNKMAKTILQDVVVLSTGRSVTNNAARVVEPDNFNTGKDKVRSLVEDYSFASVSLEVTPEQAQTLALVASGDATMFLSLRNNDDTERTNLGATAVSDLMGTDAAKLRLPAGRR